jgi:hypothetical protein
LLAAPAPAGLGRETARFVAHLDAETVLSGRTPMPKAETISGQSIRRLRAAPHGE